MIGQMISHYKILEKLGEGGMGIVYKAHDTKLNRSVALKFLPPEMTRYEAEKHRFMHEARAASALDHPNIGVVHEIGETEDGRSFICMAYYQGETLKKKIERGPLGIQETINIAIQITEGLRRAHEAGIIHRDIKPANVLITDRGEVKIVDFGLAKLIGDTTSTGGSRARAGTAAYMSPEQIQGGEVDNRTDLFSLGVVLYEMVTGNRPFAGEHEVALFYSIVNLEPQSPRKMKIEIPAELEKIILKLLQKDLIKRYQSADELLTDLNSLNRGIKIPDIPRFNRMVRYIAKQKLIASLFFAGIILLCIFLVTRKSTTTLSLEPSEYVLIANFENLTNNRVFDHSLSEAIKVSLRQSTRLNLFPPERITETLKRMKVSEIHPLNDTLAVAVARREGVRVVIAGGISPLGTSYALSLKIIDAVSGEMIRRAHREVTGVEKVLSAMDQLCEDIRASLGESVQEISKYSMPLEKVTTPSLEALELYSRGDILQNQGDFNGAAVLKEQAVAKDSLFTFAISDLSYIHRKLRNDSVALYYHNRVLPLLSRVTERERLYILSMYYGPSGAFDLPKAIQNIRQFVVLYSNDPLGYAQLGWLAMYSGDTKTAVEAGQHSIAIDSVYAGTVYNNMGYAHAQSGNADSALYYFAKSKKLRPSYTAIDAYIVQSRWLKEEYDSAESSLKSLLTVGDPKRKILTYFQLISLWYFRGRLNEAEQYCSKAITLCDGEKLVDDIAYIHYLRGEVAADQKNFTLYRDQMRRAEHRSRSPFLDIPLIGSSYARHGQVNEAETTLQKLSTLRCADPYFIKRRHHFYHLIEGEILLARAYYMKAIDEFSAVKKIQGADPYFLLAQEGIARCYIRMKDTAAVAMLKNFLERRGEAVNAFVLAVRNAGIWTRDVWPEAHFELGKLYCTHNNKQEAEFHLRKCLECWDHADKQFTEANEARVLLNKLTGGPPTIKY